MRPLFPEGRVNYILRTYLPPWNFEGRLEEIVRFCEETDTRHVMLFTDAQFMVWNQLTLPEAGRIADLMAKAGERLAGHGIRLGVNASYNMRMSRWDHRGHLDYDHWATYADGSCDYRGPCLLDPKLETYLAAFFKLLAQAGPDYIYVDDDHRYMLVCQKDTWGCFCDLHLERFSALTGGAWTRERLGKALLQDLDVRSRWIDFLGRRLVELGEVISSAVHAVCPEIEVGMMVPCVHVLPVIGHDLKNVLASFKPVSKPLVRPCIGGYNDHNRRVMAAGLFYLEFIRHHLGADVTYTPEVESCPFTRFSKGMAVTRLDIIQGLLNQMNNPALTVCGYNGDSPYFEPTYAPMLKESRPYFEALRRIAPAPESRKGVQLLWAFESAKLDRRPISSVNDLIWPSFSCHEFLSNMGFPLSYEESPVRLLAGESLRAFPRERIERILSQNVILDASAACALLDMGFGSLVGCASARELDAFGSELCVSPEFCGSHVGTFIPLSQVVDNAVWQFELAASAVELSEIVDQDFARLAPGVSRFENALGGKVCLLPYAISHTEPNPAHLICHQRRTMLRTVVDWMDANVLRFFVEDQPETLTQVWEEGGVVTVCLTNLSLDLAQAFEVSAPGLDLRRGEVLDSQGKIAPLLAEVGMAGRWRVRHVLAPFVPLLLRLPRH